MKRTPDHGEIATGVVRDWLLRKGAGHPDIEEAAQIVRVLDHLPAAREQLKSWFGERVAAGQEEAGEFSDLRRNLLGRALDQVDWETIVRLIREHAD